MGEIFVGLDNFRVADAWNKLQVYMGSKVVDEEGAISLFAWGLVRR